MLEMGRSEVLRERAWCVGDGGGVEESSVKKNN